MRWTKQSQRKPVKPHEEKHKSECNDPEQHQQEKRGEGDFQNRTTEESDSFLAVPSCNAFFQGRWQVDKTTKTEQITKNVISPKATVKTSFSGISKIKTKKTVKTRFKNG